jgi:predicted dehydrogenase
LYFFLIAVVSTLSYAKEEAPKKQVRLITLDPGHFHAALVQKIMYADVSPIVHVYAPDGPDVQEHLKRIEAFNTHAENPTSWQEKIYTGDDFLQKMLQEKNGNLVVISGNNKNKAQYIKACVDAGLNVLADKPMCINPNGFDLLLQAFDSAKKHKVLLYDIMTERSEITTILQKELVHDKDVFGQLQKGTVDDPAVVQESVHHFFKLVSGSPLKRPAWYFDTAQQGEGIVDVTTHLVDLVLWECFPNQALDYEKDIRINAAKRSPTIITRQQFSKVTGLDDFPDFLKSKLNDKGELACYANGEIIFTVKDIYSKVSVKWNFDAPEGTKDTHYSIIKGTKANLLIRQGAEENYNPELYVQPITGGKQIEKALNTAIARLQKEYAGIGLVKEGDLWHVLVPQKYRVGHEEHFGQVMQRYLNYLAEGKLPKWETTNMKAKYYTTTKALELASQ